MDIHKYASAMEARTLELLFSEVKIVECASEQVVYRGIGRAFINANRALCFQFRPHADQEPWTRPYSPGASGSLLRDDDFLRLEATEPGGVNWVSDRFRRTTIGPLPFTAIPPVIHIRSLTHTAQLDEGDEFARLFFARIPPLPLNRRTETIQRRSGFELATSMTHDHFEGLLGSDQFKVEKQADGMYVVSLTASQSLPPQAISAVSDALELALAAQAVPTLTFVRRREGSETRLQEVAIPRPRSNFFPPVSSDFFTADNFWRFVSDAYKMFCDDGINAETIRGCVASARQGDGAGAELACLSLSVAIEKLSTTVLPKLSGVDLTAQEVGQLRATLASDSVYTRAQLRIDGVLQLLTHPQPKSVLRSWCERENVPLRLVTAWSDLRNKYAHGKSVSDQQELVDTYLDVLELLYSIIAFRMGFRGQLVQYSEKGWPLLEVPRPEPAKR